MPNSENSLLLDKDYKNKTLILLKNDPTGNDKNRLLKSYKAAKKPQVPSSGRTQKTAAAAAASKRACNELAVGERERLEAGAVGRQLRDGRVRDEDALLEVHPLQLVARPGQGLRAQEAGY